MCFSLSGGLASPHLYEEYTRHRFVLIVLMVEIVVHFVLTVQGALHVLVVRPVLVVVPLLMNEVY